jgi:hypothetical protein
MSTALIAGISDLPLSGVKCSNEAPYCRVNGDRNAFCACPYLASVMHASVGLHADSWV